jgi:DnaJ-class molecular chaperone
MRRSAYEILGVARTASSEEIRRAFKTLVKTAHPDHAGESGHERFLEIKAAYEILVDDQSRSAYDRDPDGVIEARVYEERRAAQRLRRRKRLRRLYE